MKGHPVAAIVGIILRLCHCVEGRRFCGMVAREWHFRDFGRYMRVLIFDGKILQFESAKW